MNLKITIAAFTITALGLVAGFDVIPGASLPTGMTVLVIGGALLP